MKTVARTFCFAITTLLLAYGMVSTIDGVWMMALISSTPFVFYIVHSFVPQAPQGLARNLRNVSVFFFVGILMIGAQLAHYQFAVADNLNHAVLTSADGEILSNPRIVDEEKLSLRGSILDRNGVALASSHVTDNGTIERTYADPSVSTPVGYFSPLMYGASNLEAEYDSELRGSTNLNPLLSWVNRFLHRPQQGNNLVLTLDLDLQKVAREALGDRVGAVVALDPRSGAVLAMASSPSYDPSQLFVPAGEGSSERADKAAQYWKELQANDQKPFLDRAIQGLYPPGSTFKTVTLSAALDSGTVTASTMMTDTGQLNVDGHKIVEANRPQPPKDQYTVAQGYIYSLNVVFAQLGLMLGPDKLMQYAQAFGIGKDLPFDLPVAQSQVSTAPDFLTNRAAIADTAYGQGELMVTPLNMALVAATVANGGVTPAPYLVQSMLSPTGDKIFEHQSKELGRPMQPAAAQEVQRIMVQSVEEGWAKPAQIPGIRVAGKSGTAEVEGTTPHAWFIAYAPAENPQIAVAVVIEHGGEGIQEALPVAKQVIQTWLQKHP